MNENTLPASTSEIPRPYSSDGGFTISGMMLTIAVGGFAALAMGLLAGFIAQYFYFVLLFPLAIGAAVGGSQVAVIGRTKIRNPLVCGFAGLIAGAIAVTSMHYVDYYRFQADMIEAAASLEESELMLQGIEDEAYRAAFAEELATYKSDPSRVAAKNVNSFIAYVDWAAHQGVELSSSRGTGSSSNLGYTGTYIYWAFEALIVASLCILMTYSRAGKPYCTGCDSWMQETELVSLGCDAKAASKAIAAGDLHRLPTIFAANKETSIVLFSCESCEENDVVVQPTAITYNNGNRHKSAAGRHVFNASMLQKLNQLFFDTSSSDDKAVDRLAAQVNGLVNEASLHTQETDRVSQQAPSHSARLG